MLGRKTERYRLALDIARLILLDHSPRLRAGDVELLALLFDMNALWEAYVAAILRRAAESTVEVRTQESRIFWRAPGRRRRTLRPDIVLYERGVNAPFGVIDTKWKVPRNGQPSDGDLKQMFAYNELLGTAQAVLLYPTEGLTQTVVRGTFAAGGHCCETSYVSAIEPKAQDRCGELIARLRGRADGPEIVIGSRMPTDGTNGA